MKIIYEGKTKDLVEEGGKFFCHFKDDMTGTDGVFDTGGNEVVGSVEGAGSECIKVSTFFFELLEKKGIKTHFISSDLDKNRMEVRKAHIFGKGLEVITRYKAVGSFIRRYGRYGEEGMELDGYTEFTLKDDERNDPLITKDGLTTLNILSDKEYEQIKELNQKISGIIRDVLEEKGLTLYDIKLEYGRLDDGNEIVLIDEVSGGNMRVYQGDRYIEPLELSKYLDI
ncbi:MAG: phosphoribosylaminoimidazolesuccinocarboxamide synthase [Tissierellia bacterium]|nr:phosphoribosylaminoimidazolesuccinocarboxamide synthase [Tissierellia bacterium]